MKRMKHALFVILDSLFSPLYGNITPSAQPVRVRSADNMPPNSPPKPKTQPYISLPTTHR